MDKRKETRVDGCLLQANISYPRKDVVLCGVCPNRSDMVGNMGELCHMVPEVVQE